MNQEKYIKPCKLADDLYCFGVSGSPAHLLLTTDGLVVIDTGRPEALDMLLLNLSGLGFAPGGYKAYNTHPRTHRPRRLYKGAPLDVQR